MKIFDRMKEKDIISITFNLSKDYGLPMNIYIRYKEGNVINAKSGFFGIKDNDRYKDIDYMINDLYVNQIVSPFSINKKDFRVAEVKIVTDDLNEKCIYAKLNAKILKFFSINYIIEHKISEVNRNEIKSDDTVYGINNLSMEEIHMIRQEFIERIEMIEK